MIESPSNDFVNVSAHLEGMPPVYDRPPQDDTARAFAQSLLRILRSGRKLDKKEMDWLNLYNRYKAKGRNREEIDDYIDEYNKKDIHLFFMDKIEKIQENYEKRIADILKDHRKEMSEKDKRIDDLVARIEEQKSKDFVNLVKLVSEASKEGAENANKHLATALTATNSLNSTLMSTMQTQWQNVGNFSKKQFEELNKLLEQKEKEEPGFIDSFLEHIVLPNQDKIGNFLNRIAAPLLQNSSK